MDNEINGSAVQYVDVQIWWIKLSEINQWNTGQINEQHIEVPCKWSEIMKQVKERFHLYLIRWDRGILCKLKARNRKLKYWNPGKN